jgi:hypothetical protein
MLATQVAGVIHLGEDASALRYRHRCSSSWRASAPQRTAACKLKPCMSALSACLKPGDVYLRVATFWRSVALAATSRKRDAGNLPVATVGIGPLCTVFNYVQNTDAVSLQAA